MTALILAVLAATGPCLYWTQGPETRGALDTAGVTRLCVPEASAAAWQGSGLTIVPVAAADLAARETLPAPGVESRPGVASPTRAPWLVANGWRLLRRSAGSFVGPAATGRGAMAAAEAVTYGADTLLQIDPADLPAAAAILALASSLPAVDLPLVADLGVVDDGTPATGEVMNLLARRNLLFAPVAAGSRAYPLVIAVGSPAFPASDAADPSAFAQKVRAQVTDPRRSLRLYGSEVVIGHLTGSPSRQRLHLINYGGRDIEGLRVRVRGTFRTIECYVPGTGRIEVTDVAVADGGTEFSIPRMAVYAVVELK